MESGEEVGGQGRRSVWVFVSLAGVSAALTVLYLGMRAVMDIGGACAEGGPFVPVRPCPTGVPLLMIGGIWLGIVFAGVYAWNTIGKGGPNVVGLLWSALFLSLGWNFLDYGLDPPFGEGPDWGWLVCAIVFGLMGGLPLIAALPATLRSFRGQAPFEPAGMSRLGSLKAVVPSVSSWRVASAPTATTTRTSTSTPSSSESDEVVDALERLDALRRSGAIDDAEYRSAKRKVLGEEGP